MKAVAKYARISPRKARLVADQVRGKPYTDALSILEFTDKHAADFVKNVVESAGANAENNFGIPPEFLTVGKIMVDEGPTIKRYRPRALGRAVMIRKRTSHITVELGGAEELSQVGAEEEEE